MALKSKALDLVRPDVPVHEAVPKAPPSDAPVRVNLLVPPALRKAWKEAALREDTTVTDLIIAAVNAHLAR